MINLKLKIDKSLFNLRLLTSQVKLLKLKLRAKAAINAKMKYIKL